MRDNGIIFEVIINTIHLIHKCMPLSNDLLIVTQV